MFHDQVDLQVNHLPKDSLKLLATKKEVQSIEPLDERDTVASVWKSSPPNDMLHLFVEFPAAGEQKLVAVNGTPLISFIISVMLSCSSLSCCPCWHVSCNYCCRR
jgi:hypothetical protein